MSSTQKFLICPREGKILVYGPDNFSPGASMVMLDGDRELDVSGHKPVKFNDDYAPEAFDQRVEELRANGYDCDFVRAF